MAAFFRSAARSRGDAPAKPGAPSAQRAAIGQRVGERLDADPRMVRAETPHLQFYWGEHLFDDTTCDRLVAMIDVNRRPSTLLSDRANSEFRTSDSCDMDRWSDAIRPLDGALAELLGIPPEQGETMQGQRYAPGQHFRAHHDYFHENEAYWQRMRVSGGQRTWTAMVYLNDVEEGGATWFPQAGIKVAPRKGLLLTWNNMGADGSPNVLTTHEGMPVVAGVKYIVTKWFREEKWIGG